MWKKQTSIISLDNLILLISLAEKNGKIASDIISWQIVMGNKRLFYLLIQKLCLSFLATVSPWSRNSWEVILVVIILGSAYKSDRL